VCVCVRACDRKSVLMLAVVKTADFWGWQYAAAVDPTVDVFSGVTVFNRPAEGADQEAQRKKDPRARPRPLYDIPYMFEAREFLRKKLICKKVNICISSLLYLLAWFVNNTI